MKGLLSGPESPRPPGLVSREIIDADDETVTIREVWDPRVPGCPMFAFNPKAAFVEHTFEVRHYGDKPEM